LIGSPAGRDHDQYPVGRLQQTMPGGEGFERIVKLGPAFPSDSEASRALTISKFSQSLRRHRDRLQRSVHGMGPGLRRRGPRHRHPRPAPPPLRSDRDQRPELPAQEPPPGHRARDRHGL